MDRSRVSNNFSRYAFNYDFNSDVQQKVATDLVQKIDGKYSKIMDVGCGTGYLTEKVFEKTGAESFGIDISEGMVRAATLKRPCFDFINISAEESLFKFSGVDLIVSSFALHWLDNLIDFLLSAIQATSVAFSFPVLGSLKELDSSFADAYSYLGEPCISHLISFPDSNVLAEKLLKHDDNIKISYKDYSVNYKSPLDALKAIKNIGGNYSQHHLSVGLAKKLFSHLSIKDDSFFVTWKIMTIVSS